MRFYGFTRRVVIDTNVLISALLSKNGSAAQFMSGVFDEKYEVIITESIMREYADVLAREQFAIDKDIQKDILRWFAEYGVFVEVDESDYPKEEMPDPDDAVFFVAARCTGALLVTKNIRHYPVTEWRTMIWELL